MRRASDHLATYRCLRQHFDTVRQTLRQISLQPDDRLMIDYFISLSDCGAPAWKFVTEKIPQDTLDRRRGLIGGPLLTTAHFPWPQEGGNFLTPVIQVRLKEFSKLSGFPFGDGLLQIWAEGRNGVPGLLVRVIPESDLSSRALEPPYLLDGLNYNCWLEIADRARPRWAADVAMQIVGYTGPRFSMPIYELDYVIDELEPILIREHCIRSAARLRRTKRLLKRCQDVWASYAFGTFERLTLGPDETPPTLFNLGSDLPFWFSESGQLQAFFEFDINGKPQFRASWQVMP